MWESARRFSEEHAYPGKAFPVLDEDRRCVLCQQTLEEEGRERLSRFDRFVKDDTQVRLREARRLHDSQVEHLTSLAISPEAVANNLKDLEVTYRDLVSEIRELLMRYETVHEQTREALGSAGEIPQLGIDPGTIITRLTEAGTTAKETAEDLANPEVIQERLVVLAQRRADRARPRGVLHRGAPRCIQFGAHPG